MTNTFLTTARIAGILYLLVAVGGGFAEIVRTSLVESGDAAATVENIEDAKWLFRLSFGSDLIAFSSDIALALVLYALLRPVNQTIALLAAFFRMAQGVALGVNLLNQFFALIILSGEEYLTAFDPDQLDALVLLFLDAHGFGYLIGLVFFAISSFFLGYLVYRSGYLPRLIGLGLMTFVAFGYFIDSFASFFGNEEEIVSVILIGPATIVELSFVAWLLIFGGRVRPEPPPAEAVP